MISHTKDIRSQPRERRWLRRLGVRAPHAREHESLDAYLVRLDLAVADAAAQRRATLESVMCGARGAFPSLVFERLSRLGLEASLSRDETAHVAPIKYRPELHPLDYEWYFTPSCAKAIADFLPRRMGDGLYLGAPTVAAATAGLGRRSVLVDQNELIALRLPQQERAPDFVLHDLRRPLKAQTKFGVVFFDAPWYMEYVALWLAQASRLVRRGGLVGFVLFPDLLRPNARAEREYVLDLASRIGDLEIMDGAVSYDTPAFERQALLASGVVLNSNWRSGDLIIVKRRRDLGHNPGLHEAVEDPWETFVIEEQVVKLRRFTLGDRPGLEPIEGCKDYTLPSVSRRDARRYQVDLWTSRNRVARVRDRDRLAHLLANAARFRGRFLFPALEGDERLVADLQIVLGAAEEESAVRAHGSDVPMTGAGASV